jgi:hypothetical protein
MRDEMDARIWNEHHEAFSESIDTLVARFKGALAGIKPALNQIHRFEWDAPWRRKGAGQA